jgi:hypothetical protein
MQCSATTHASLADILPEGIDFVPRSSALELLGISRQQLGRDQWVLAEVGVKGFDYSKGGKGFSRSALEILFLYRQLVRERGVEKALEKIIELTEGAEDGASTQGSGRTGSQQTEQWF